MNMCFFFSQASVFHPPASYIRCWTAGARATGLRGRRSTRPRLFLLDAQQLSSTATRSFGALLLDGNARPLNIIICASIRPGLWHRAVLGKQPRRTAGGTLRAHPAPRRAAAPASQLFASQPNQRGIRPFM